MEKTKEIQEAIDTLIAYGTLPPQIDYISPAEKAKMRAAEELLKDNQEAMDEVSEAITEYYESDISYLDSLF